MVATQTCFYFTPKIGEDFQFGEHIFQMAWFNHQLVMETLRCFSSGFAGSPQELGSPWWVWGRSGEGLSQDVQTAAGFLAKKKTGLVYFLRNLHSSCHHRDLKMEKNANFTVDGSKRSQTTYLLRCVFFALLK